MKPQSRFWHNIRRLVFLSGAGGLVQFSVFVTPDRVAALSVLKLVAQYDGEVKAYRLGEALELPG